MYELHGVCHLWLLPYTRNISNTHAYANPIVVCISSARAKVYTMLRQIEWCYSVMRAMEYSINNFIYHIISIIDSYNTSKIKNFAWKVLSVHIDYKLFWYTDHKL